MDAKPEFKVCNTSRQKAKLSGENRTFVNVPADEVKLVEWIGEHEKPDIQFNWRQQQQLLDLNRANLELKSKVREAEIMKQNLSQFYSPEQLKLLC